MTSHKVVTAEYICYFTWIVSSHRRQEWVKGGGGGGGVRQVNGWQLWIQLYLRAVLHFDPCQVSDLSTARPTLSSAGDPGDKWQQAGHAWGCRVGHWPRGRNMSLHSSTFFWLTPAQVYLKCFSRSLIKKQISIFPYCDVITCMVKWLMAPKSAQPLPKH